MLQVEIAMIRHLIRLFLCAVAVGAVACSPYKTQTPSAASSSTIPDGPDKKVVVQLSGSASDDGLPTPARLSMRWTQVSGPAPVAFDNASNPRAKATFRAAGVYVLRLTADDGALKNSSDITINVVDKQGP
jgi:hypothetical protein